MQLGQESSGNGRFQAHEAVGMGFMHTLSATFSSLLPVSRTFIHYQQPVQNTTRSISENLHQQRQPWQLEEPPSTVEHTCIEASTQVANKPLQPSAGVSCGESDEPTLEAPLPTPSAPVAAEPAVTAEGAIIAEAAEVVRQAICCKGLDSEWTSSLASALMPLCRTSGELQEIVARHHWNGAQFASPPSRQRLLDDLEASSGGNLTLSEAMRSTHFEFVFPCAKLEAHGIVTSPVYKVPIASGEEFPFRVQVTLLDVRTGCSIQIHGGNPQNEHHKQLRFWMGVGNATRPTSFQLLRGPFEAMAKNVEVWEWNSLMCESARVVIEFSSARRMSVEQPYRALNDFDDSAEHLELE